MIENNNFFLLRFFIQLNIKIEAVFCLLILAIDLFQLKFSKSSYKSKTTILTFILLITEKTIFNYSQLDFVADYDY